MTQNAFFLVKRDKMVAFATTPCCFCNFDIMKDKWKFLGGILLRPLAVVAEKFSEL